MCVQSIHRKAVMCLKLCQQYAPESNISSASPIQQDVKIKYSTVTFEGSFSNPNSSVFRLHPGKEVDDAWLSLGVQSWYPSYDCSIIL